jgi:enoyl-CoA hydratase
MPDLVLDTVTDRVALITVSDPDRRNAVTDAMSVGLRAAIERAEADDGVHAVVVTGAGKAFCAGADLGALGAGLNLALVADVRLAGPHAVFDPRFQSLGLHPGGATWMLQRGVGPQVARAALLFGARFNARQAVQHGLALRVVEDPVGAALQLAAGPASNSAPRRRPSGHRNSRSG